MTFDEKVYDYLRTVPFGTVTTYGLIALHIGHPRAARQAGQALHRNPMPGIIPCHRVVNREGRLATAFAFGGIEMQARLLCKEGIEVVDGCVDLNKYLWR